MEKQNEIPNHSCSVTDNRRKSLDCAFNKGDGMKDEKPLDPWVVVAPDGLRWIGLAKNEHHAWQFALGWPDQKEIADTKAIGWYAVKGNLTWSKP